MTKVNKNDMVTVTCYGTTKTMKRGEAIKFYNKGLSFCDPYSSEAGRYQNVLAQLRAGMTEVNDQNEDW